MARTKQFTRNVHRFPKALGTTCYYLLRTLKDRGLDKDNTLNSAMLRAVFADDMLPEFNYFLRSVIHQDIASATIGDVLELARRIFGGYSGNSDLSDELREIQRDFFGADEDNSRADPYELTRVEGLVMQYFEEIELPPKQCKKCETKLTEDDMPERCNACIDKVWEDDKENGSVSVCQKDAHHYLCRDCLVQVCCIICHTTNKTLVPCASVDNPYDQCDARLCTDSNCMLCHFRQDHLRCQVCQGGERDECKECGSFCCLDCGADDFECNQKASTHK